MYSDLLYNPFVKITFKREKIDHICERLCNTYHQYLTGRLNLWCRPPVQEKKESVANSADKLITRTNKAHGTFLITFRIVSFIFFFDRRMLLRW